MDGVSKNSLIIPTNFGLKYNPPKLGIQYYFKENPKATFVHEVSIDNVENKKAEDLINELFTKHKKFVDPKVVSRNQLENLMERLKSNIEKSSAAKNKENMQENINNKPTDLKVGKVDTWGMDADSVDNKQEEIGKPKNFEKDIFSGAQKEEFKTNEKELNFDDFDMDNEDQKINDGHDMFDGLDDDQSNNQDSNMDDDRGTPKDTPDNNEDEDDSDAIDIDNEEELAARGLKKIQIEGEEEEFLMDAEGNIYNLNGDFIGTTNGDAEEDGATDEDEF